MVVSCGEAELPDPIHPPVTPDTNTTVPAVITPAFNADSAFSFVEAQLNFGPRVPNTAEHDSCAKYLVKKLESYCTKVIVQTGKVKAYTGAFLDIQNIIAQFEPDRANRLMFCAHWDTRHVADRDPDKPVGKFDGANDGASGVAVLIEIARNLCEQDPNIGVDLILFDAEDYGSSQLSQGMMSISNMDDTWCLGSQYWAKNPPIPNYKPQFAVLLDMVGAENATFPKEGYSLQYANPYVQAVWSKAQNMGYGQYFINHAIGGITDDHKYINEIAQIPAIDIIHYDVGRGDFGRFHHTHADNLGIINKSTMEVVGHVCLEIIYQGL